MCEQICVCIQYKACESVGVLYECGLGVNRC